MKRHMLILAALALPLAACGANHEPATPTMQISDEQMLVERASHALIAMRNGDKGTLINALLPRARGVLIFPRIVKAGVLLGGEGGNGVLMARDSGGWSAPVFYGLGGPSVGLQVGYQEATLLVFLMTDDALQSTLDGGFSFEGDLSVAAGSVGDAGEAERGSPSSDVIYVADVDGVFAGASVDGMVIDERDGFNAAYYGPGATPRAIALERRYDNPGAAPLRQAVN